MSLYEVEFEVRHKVRACVYADNKSDIELMLKTTGEAVNIINSSEPSIQIKSVVEVDNDDVYE